MYVAFIYEVMYVYIYSVSEIVELTSQFATQYCLGCYSKLKLGYKFHLKVATHLRLVKFGTLYTLNITL